MSGETVNCADLTFCIETLVFKGQATRLSFSEKKQIISSPKPTPNLKIFQPSKTHNRYFNRSIYNTVWIAGCSHINKLFCWYCIFFSNDKNVWNTSGYNDLNNISTAIKRHQNSHKHLSAVISFHNFGKQRIETSLSRQLSEDISRHNLKVDYNRSVFQRLVDIVCLLAQQELPFRGHDESETSLNKGNFLECVTLLSKYDTILEKHIQQDGPSYLSSKIQNDIIHSIADVLKEQIEFEIRNCSFVSIILDETPDVSRREQLCVILRYFYDNDIHDRFLGFIDVSTDRTAEKLTEIILEFIEKFECGSKIVAQCYDGASVMSGIKNGVQSKIKQKFPQAMYIWCNAHILNLILSKSCARIGEVSVFFLPFIHSCRFSIIVRKEQLTTISFVREDYLRFA